MGESRRALWGTVAALIGGYSRGEVWSKLTKPLHVPECTCLTSPQGRHMETIEPLAPSKRVRIVLCSATLAVAAIVPGAGFAADWSSGVTSPTADWSSSKRAPKADWSSGKRAPKADWSSARVAPKADWSSRYRASALR
jgi:hypothetical protein